MLLFQSCDLDFDFSGITDPPVFDDGYNWSETPIAGGPASGLWGSSPNDMWAIDWFYIHHYDGKEWTKIDLPFSFTNQYLSSLYGFGPNDVYVTGYNTAFFDGIPKITPFILHYDGNTWTSQLPQDYDSNIQLLDIHGINPDNVWAVGTEGAVYHYNGAAWRKQPFPDSIDNYSVFALPDGRTFMCGEYFNNDRNPDLAVYYFMEFNGNSWSIVDTNSIRYINNEWQMKKFGYKDIWGSGINNFYTAGGGVFKYNNPGWTIINWGGNPENIHGLSWNDVYLVADEGCIRHFDGNQWYNFKRYAGTIYNFRRVFAFKDQFFVMAEKFNDKNYIFHAVRKN